MVFLKMIFIARHYFHCFFIYFVHINHIIMGFTIIFMTLYYHYFHYLSIYLIDIFITSQYLQIFWKYGIL